MTKFDVDREDEPRDTAQNARVGTAQSAVPTPAREDVLPASRRQWAVVALVLVVAFALRVGVVVATNDYVPLNDAVHFDQIASSLAEGHGYPQTVLPGAHGPSAFRAPLYPLTLAAVYKAVGSHRYNAGRLANAVIGVALVAAIALLASLLWGKRVGLIALIVAAVHPTLMLFGSSLQLEPLLALLLVGALAAAVRHRQAPDRLRWALLAGVLTGLCILTREIGVALILPVFLLTWSGRPSWSRKRTLAPVLATLVAVAVVVPWTIRNASTLDAFVPVTTTSGVGLAGTYNQTVYDKTDEPALWLPPWVDPAMADVMRRRPDATEVTLDRDLRAAAIDFAKDHPAYVPKVMFWNTVRLFDLKGPSDALFISQYIPYPKGLTRISVYSSYVTDLLAVGALFLPLVRRAPKAIWLVPVTAWAILAILSGNIRYRASIEPFTLLLASVAIAAIVARVRPVETSVA